MLSKQNPAAAGFIINRYVFMELKFQVNLS